MACELHLSSTHLRQETIRGIDRGLCAGNDIMNAPQARPPRVPPETDLVLVLPGTAVGLEVGCASRAVAGKMNEDRVAVARPPEDELVSHGLAIAVADGIDADGAGARAAAIAVSAVLRDYYATPREWSARQALDRVLQACNQWLNAHNSRHREQDGALATLSMLLFRGTSYTCAHVGDTRVYRRRGVGFKQLTTDHLWPREDVRHLPKRAIGLDRHLVVEYTEGEAAAGDVFLLVTDGVWEVLGDAALRDALDHNEATAQQVAEDLVAQALDRQARYMGRNDATATVVRLARADTGLS
jgi:protein phosphatase